MTQREKQVGRGTRHLSNHVVRAARVSQLSRRARKASFGALQPLVTAVATGPNPPCSFLPVAFDSLAARAVLPWTHPELSTMRRALGRELPAHDILDHPRLPWTAAAPTTEMATSVLPHEMAGIGVGAVAGA